MKSILGIIGKNKYRLLIAILFLLTIYTTQLINVKQDNLLHIDFFNVGQGDSILITTPFGNRVLVDGGPNKSVSNSLSDEFGILPCKLDLIVVTHPHADHVSGLSNVIEKCEVKKVLLSGVEYDSKTYTAFVKSIETLGLPVSEAKTGDKFISDKVIIEVLWPKGGFMESKSYGENVNNTSIVLLIDYGEFEAVLTGDAESEVQEQIGLEIDTEVIKVPHQGSIDALNEDFLERTKPDLAIVSVGKNSYGHPSDKVLGEYDRRDINILRTDKEGSIEVVSDGESWWVN